MLVLYVGVVCVCCMLVLLAHLLSLATNPGRVTGNSVTGQKVTDRPDSNWQNSDRRDSDCLDSNCFNPLSLFELCFPIDWKLLVDWDISNIG